MTLDEMLAESYCADYAAEKYYERQCCANCDLLPECDVLMSRVEEDCTP